jgi:hypothetical protein
MRLENPTATEVVKDEKQEKAARIQVAWSKGGFGSVQDRLNREYCRTFRAQYLPKRPVGDILICRGPLNLDAGGLS